VAWRSAGLLAKLTDDFAGNSIKYVSSGDILSNVEDVLTLLNSFSRLAPAERWSRDIHKLDCPSLGESVLESQSLLLATPSIASGNIQGRLHPQRNVALAPVIPLVPA